MTREPSAQEAEPPGEAARSFPVPRNRPVLTPAEEEAAPSWQRRGLAALLVLALGMAAVAVWLFLRPTEKPAPVPKVEARVVSDDLAVEIYFTPSQPEELPPVVDHATPLPVRAVSLDALFGPEGK